MSIPLIQEATKDAINTSIIAIKRNIERINMLLGLVDNDSPDLSGFATKQELQDAVTELQPVDEVTIGNMHSVSSNAVAEALAEIDVTNKITPVMGTTVLKAIKKGNQVFMTFDVATTSSPFMEIAIIDDEISPNYRVVGSACFPTNAMANSPVSTVIEHYNNGHHINVYTGSVSQVLVTFNYFI